jgi:ArsR family metal-binding transcriptional regulator
MTAEEQDIRVTLAEMRGDLKMVLQQQADLLPRVHEHDKDIVALKLDTQRLTIEADARKAAIKEAEAAVRAVKLADHESEIAETARASRVTIPWERILWGLGLLAAVVMWAVAR